MTTYSLPPPRTAHYCVKPQAYVIITTHQTYSLLFYLAL